MSVYASTVSCFCSFYPSRFILNEVRPLVFKRYRRCVLLLLLLLSSTLWKNAILSTRCRCSDDRRLLWSDESCLSSNILQALTQYFGDGSVWWNVRPVVRGIRRSNRHMRCRSDVRLRSWSNIHTGSWRDVCERFWSDVGIGCPLWRACNRRIWLGRICRSRLFLTRNKSLKCRSRSLSRGGIVFAVRDQRTKYISVS
jgi:hypothetical protein